MACCRSSAYTWILRSEDIVAPDTSILVYMLFYRPYLLTVKAVLGLRCVHDHIDSSSTGLRGTPVVPGVAAGPALLVRGEVSPEAIARFGDGASPTPTPRWRRTTTRSRAVADGFARKAAKATGAGRRGAHRQRRPGPGQGPARCGRARTSRPATAWCSPCDAAVEQFVTIFTSMGGLMAERVTDLADIERRVVAHLVGEPEPGVPTPDRAVGARRRGPRARATPPGLDPGRDRAWSPSAAGRPATPRSSPASSASRAWSASPASMDIAAGARFLVVDGADRHGRDRPGRGRGRARGWPPAREARAALAAWTGPGRDVRRQAGQAARQRRRRRAAPSRPATEPVEGVGLFRTELCFLNRQRRADGRGAGRHLRRGARRLRRAGQYVVDPHPRRRARTSRSRSRRSRARRTPPSASAACGCPSATPACMDRQLDGDRARRRARPAPRPG